MEIMRIITPSGVIIVVERQQAGWGDYNYRVYAQNGTPCVIAVLWNTFEMRSAIQAAFQQSRTMTIERFEVLLDRRLF